MITLERYTELAGEKNVGNVKTADTVPATVVGRPEVTSTRLPLASNTVKVYMGLYLLKKSDEDVNP
jgi:hypothetical protein